MISEGKTDSDRLSRAAAITREKLEEAGSDKLLNLFDYLLAKSVAGEVPSEQQIASEIFLDKHSSGTSHNPNVRVSIHRLRKMIAAACDAHGGDRIEIPVGAYQIRLADEQKGRGASRLAKALAGLRFANAMSRKAAIALAAVSVVAAAAIFMALINRTVEPLSGTVAWQSFDRSSRPVTIVFGDYYMFAELDKDGTTGKAGPTLVWDRSVPTREDLTIYQMLHPAAANDTADFDQHFVSAATIEALSLLRGALARLPSSRYANVKIVAASQMTPEMLRDSDIIYVGQFSGMPVLLRDPLEQASSLKLSSQFDSLSESDGTRRYQSDGMVLTDERIARRDYAYLAELPGPAGNRLLMIVGLGEAGLREAGELMGDASQLQAITYSRAKAEDGFEGLYRVRTIGNVNVGATLIVDRPLNTAKIWDDSGDVPVYRPIEPTALDDRD